MAVVCYRYIILTHYYTKKFVNNFFYRKVDLNECIAVTDGKLRNRGFRHLHNNRNPSSNTEENLSFAYGQCRQDVSITACISTFDHTILIHGRIMHTVTE